MDPISNNYKDVQINGNIANLTDGKVKLYYLFPAPTSYKLVDSADLINGKFSFIKTIDEPCIVLLKIVSINNREYYTRSFWIENGRINIKLSLENDHLVDKIEGSEIDRLASNLNFFWSPSSGIYNLQNDSIKDKYFKKLTKIIESNNLSFFMLHGINQARGFLSSDEIKFLLSKLSYNSNIYPTGKKLSHFLQINKNLDVNNYLPKNDYKDLNGNSIDLSQICKDKIVLIDFWATWCIPCLMQIENLKEIHSKYSKRGFEIISISIDDDSEAWVSGSRKIKIPWINLIGDSLVKDTYGLTFIPQNILVNQSGLILKKNLSVTEIDKQLNTLLKF